MKKLLSFMMPAMALMLFSHGASANMAAMDLLDESVSLRQQNRYEALEMMRYEGGGGGGTVVQSLSCSNPLNGTCSSCNTNTGVCRSVTCNSGYYASGTSCVSCSNISVTNGSCTACSSSGSCTTVSCNTGYKASGTSCIVNAVAITNRFSNTTTCPTGMTKSSDGCCCVNQIASIVNYADLEAIQAQREFVRVDTSAFTASERFRLAEFIAE